MMFDIFTKVPDMRVRSWAGFEEGYRTQLSTLHPTKNLASHARRACGHSQMVRDRQSDRQIDRQTFRQTDLQRSEAVLYVMTPVLDVGARIQDLAARNVIEIK